MQRFLESGGERQENDSSAYGAADSIGAQAFTNGNRITFRRGAYSPHTSTGRQLIARELTHVIRARGQDTSPGRMVPIKTRMSSHLIPRTPVTVNKELRERVEYCIKTFYYDDQIPSLYAPDRQQPVY